MRSGSVLARDLLSLEIPKQSGSPAYPRELRKDGSTYQGRGSRADGSEVTATAHHSEGRIAGLWIEDDIGHPFILEMGNRRSGRP